MKNIIVLCLLFLSCKSLFKRNTQDFIPGMYIRVIDHEFAQGGDTLVITRIKDSIYQIVKRSGFARILNGRQQPFELHTEIWLGIYDERAQLIHESRKGKLLIPLPKENKLLVGTSLYEKISP